MKWILPLLRNAEQIYLVWALREISPLHPDVPALVRRLNHLENCK